MALNFSHRPIFAGNLSEENLRMGNGYRVEGIPEHDVENCYDYGIDRCDRGAAATQDCVSKDILDLLPSDPFGMDITGWLEVDYGGYQRDEVAECDDNYQLFADWNFFWNKFHPFPSEGNVCLEDKKSHGMSEFGECSTRGVETASCHSGFGSAYEVDDVLDFRCDYKDDMDDDENVCLGGDELAYHPALGFALSYLGLSDLLAVESICKSLHSTVRGDPLLWRNFRIDKPLNERITDDVLLQLTYRAQGKLQCLSLAECTKISDDGIKRVLEANPTLNKLIVPGCTKLTVEGIVHILKAFKSMGTLGVKHLHIGGVFGANEQLYEEMKLLLGTDSQKLRQSRKPHFYRRGNLYLPCDDARALDIEFCPKCQNFRLLYDCPAEGCPGLADATQACRACILCTSRCCQCGCCIIDNEYEETFCLELLCSSCSKQIVKCSERMDRKVGPARSIVLHEQR